ncbi:MAG: TolC family outer membrane protein [Gammaproteobacteria bacterium]|nr:TolC family outer membrane protein [Gammaproteobacteria bacterium]
MKKLSLTFVLLTSFTVFPASADSLLEIYQLAQKNDPTFLASEAGKQAAQERISQSRATLLPQLNAKYSISETDDEGDSETINESLPVTDPDYIKLTSSERTLDRKRLTVSLSQEIYNHGSWLNLQQSEKRALQTSLQHEASKQQLIIRVAEAYFNVLAAEDNVNFSKAEIEALSKELALTKQRFEVGLIAITDVHEAQSRHDRAFANQIAAQNALDNAHEALRQITGQYHNDLQKVQSDMLLRNPQPEDIQQWMKTAQENNLDVQAANVGMEINKKGIDISRAGHFPTITLDASYTKTDDEGFGTGSRYLDFTGQTINYSNSSIDASETTSLSLNVNVPLFSGGRTNAQVNEAQQLYLQASHQLEGALRKAIGDTRSAYLGVVAAVSSVRAFNQAVISSQSALEATQAGFEVGTRTIIDVLLQTQQLFDAKRQHARARYDYIINTLKLKQAAGLLTEKDIVQVNGMLR